MIPYIRPTLPPPDAWLPHLQAAYDARWYTNFGPVAARFEEGLTAKYGGVARTVVLAASGTAALTGVLQALAGPGRIVVPSYTFPATAQAVLAAGGVPVFCDVSPDTWELAPDALRRILEADDIRAVVHVRAFGLCHDLDPIEAAAREHGVPVIVDAAAAVGGRVSDAVWAGQQGDVEVCSLHATKVFGIGEGGAIFAPADRIPALRRALNFGLEDGDVIMPALNGKMSEFHAAIGCAMLDRIDDFVVHRQRVAARYRETLAGLPAVAACPPPAIAPYQTYPVLLERGIDVDAVIAGAVKRGVELRRYYYPALHRTTFFRPFTTEALPVTDDLAGRMLCLPVFSDMTDAEQGQVLDMLVEILPA